MAATAQFCVGQVKGQIDDSTHPDHLYHLRVPPGMTNVRQAVAWTFGLTQDDYGPEVET